MAQRRTVTLPDLVIKKLNDWRANEGYEERGYIPTFTEAVVYYLLKALDLS